MASTIQITFQVQALDGGQSVRGAVDIFYNNGIVNTLQEKLTQSVATTNFFSEVPYINGSDAVQNAQQALNFVTAFNRDYRNFGGIKNLGAKADGNVVTITAQTGTFELNSQYTGDILIVNIDPPNNNAGPTPISSTIVRSDTVGDCTTIEHTATAFGGTPPFTLEAGGTVISNTWDGTAINFNLNRGTVAIVITDTLGDTFTKTENVPRKIAAGEFKGRVTQFETYGDITIESVNPIVGTDPLTYAISNSDGTNKTPLQSSNVFAGVPLGTYTIYTQDKYGCEVSSTLVVEAFEGGIDDIVEDFFLVPKHNSIAFYDGTTERVNLKYNFKQEWKTTDVITTQFKSSFSYHNLTYKRFDGTKISVPFLEIQQNIGFKEKVDCFVFDGVANLSVYFDAGNEYTPNTNDVIGASPYNNFLPSWAVVGRGISIDGIGSTTIKSTGFDTTRQKYFFTTELPLTGSAVEINTAIQVTYNIHGYNLFQAEFDMSLLQSDGYFEYEYGYDEDQIRGSVCSLNQGILESNCKTMRYEWWDDKNRGNMVYQSGIKGYMNISGTFYKISVTEAELASGDNGYYDLKQKARPGWKLELDLLPPEIWEKLDIVTGLKYFSVGGIFLKRAKQTSVDRIGETNLREFECEFYYGSNQLSVKDDEVVLNPTTGVVGGGGTGKDPVLAAWDGKTRLVTNDGVFIETGGSLIEVNV